VTSLVWKTLRMLNRNLKIVRTHFPMTAICESCEQRFMSRNEDLEQADKEIRTAFDTHKCEHEDAVGKEDSKR
jgi:hypothetical protein